MTPEQAAALQEFLRLLATAMATSSLYSPQHKQVLRLCSQALTRFSEMLAAAGEISLLVIDDKLVVDGRPVEASMYCNRLLQVLKCRDIGLVKFRSGVTHQELLDLVAALGRGGELQSSDNIRFGRVEVRLGRADVGGGGSGEDRQRILALTDIPDVELARLLEIYESARKHRRLRVAGIAEIVGGFISAFRETGGPLLALAPLRRRDEYTFTHSTNVCILNLAQAMALGIDGPPLHEIGIAAMLHDVGKLFIPEEVLTKPGKLDDREWELVRQHPVRGAQYLLDTPGAPRLAVVTAFEHHMRYDGTGYPRVGGAWQQNVCSYLTAISDCFDALRTRRVYRGSLEVEAISAIMQAEAGTSLHPALTGNFLQILQRLNVPG
jgi:HD-GYP domain-containing protein (c-di-GMP phosphodiesterase class II)